MPSASRRSPENRFRTRGLSAASAAVGAAAISTVAARDAEAAIISDTSSIWNVGDSLFLDGTSLTELSLVSQTAGMSGMLDVLLEAPTGMDGDSLVELAVFGSGGMMAIDWLDALDYGDTVDGSLTWSSEAFLVEDTDVNTDFSAGTSAYAGFVIDSAGATPLYGWARIDFAADGESFTIDQWAYEDSGGSILAGVASATVPEPSTAFLLGLGLAGLAATRTFKG